MKTLDRPLDDDDRAMADLADVRDWRRLGGPHAGETGPVPVRKLIKRVGSATGWKPWPVNRKTVIDDQLDGWGFLTRRRTEMAVYDDQILPHSPFSGWVAFAIAPDDVAAAEAGLDEHWPVKFRAGLPALGTTGLSRLRQPARVRRRVGTRRRNRPPSSRGLVAARRPDPPVQRQADEGPFVGVGRDQLRGVPRRGGVMTTATEAAFRQQYRLGNRDARVHQGAAADPGAGSPVSQDALTSLRHKTNAAYKSAQGASQALTALSKATPPPLQHGEARTNTGTGERTQSAQTDRTTGREGQTR